MPEQPAKARVRAAFERAADSYDGAAEVQRRICQHLLTRLPAALQPQRLLDAGCGTGYALGLLHQRYPHAQALALDFSPAMLLHCRRSAPNAPLALAGDIEHLPLGSASLDLYWSSLAVQWCDLARALGEARRVLAASGQLALATLGPGTFHELRTAFAGIDRHAHTLSFVDAAQVEQLARASGFATVDVEIRQETAYYPDFRSLLKAVKAVGANQVGDGRRTSLLGRSAFARAAAAAENGRNINGLPLSYEVIFLTARA
ncbi:malonyl-ACP O-methyltransferase BioC [Dechloromonas sp. ZY10]|uniref:malonyl-ACP O-methyltransferase BioC n=1 Tax=Dechloromonas aquae TaxID=2664436 RepID=UPI003528D143